MLKWLNTASDFRDAAVECKAGRGADRWGLAVRLPGRGETSLGCGLRAIGRRRAADRADASHRPYAQGLKRKPQGVVGAYLSRSARQRSSMGKFRQLSGRRFWYFLQPTWG